LWRDTGVLASLRFRIADDFISNLVKVVELLVGEVQEFTPFVGVGSFVGRLVDAVWLLTYDG
jgi:hypothetical protein